MKSRLLSYYDQKVRARHLIYKHMKWTYWGFLLAFPIIIPFLLIIWMGFLAERRWLFQLIALSIFLLLLLFFIHKRFNTTARKVLNREYSLKTTNGTWFEYFHDIQVHLIVEYLIENDLHTKWKIENLMEAYKEDNENERMPALIAPSILIAAIAPNLNYLLKHFYELDAYKSNEGQLVIFIIVLAISIFIIGVISYWKQLFREMSDVFIYKKIGRRKNLNSILYDILLMIKE